MAKAGLLGGADGEAVTDDLRDEAAGRRVLDRAKVGGADRLTNGQDDEPAARAAARLDFRGGRGGEGVHGCVILLAGRRGRSQPCVFV